MDWATARQNMVEGQVRPNRVTDPRIIEAMLAIPREVLVPPPRCALAYADATVPVAPGRALLAPMVVARLVQEAMPEEGERALVLPGLGSYAGLLLQRMGLGVTILETPEHAAQAGALLAAAGAPSGVVTGRLDQGYAAAAPYDLIVLEGAVAALPDRLGAQLTRGGRIVGIIGEQAPRRAFRADKLGDRLTMRLLFDAAAPLLEEFAAEEAFSL